MTTKNCWLCNCDGVLIEEVFEPKYFQCPNCDLIFIDDDFILNQKQEKERYSIHNNSLDNLGYVKMLNNFIVEAVAPFTNKLDSGLEFGCGPGPVLSQLLSSMGIKMDIYDPYFFNDKSFESKKYDLITSTEVLEHVRNPKEVLDVLVSILNKNGILSIMTLFHDNCDFKTWWYRRDSTHICFYSSKTCYWIEKIFSIKIKYFNKKNICVWQK